MKEWLLFTLGTFAYLLFRFMNRKDKTVPVSFKFYLANNWPELSFTVILDLMLMLMVMDKGTTIDATGWLSNLPIGVIASGKLIASALCGLGFGKIIYEGVKKFKRDKVDKPL